MPEIQKEDSTNQKKLPSHAKVVIIGGGVEIGFFVHSRPTSVLQNRALQNGSVANSDAAIVAV